MLPPDLQWAGLPWVATVGLALACALFLGGLWPCIPELVPQQHVGLAFGAATAMQNLLLALCSLCAGQLRDSTGGYQATGIFLSCCGALGALLGLGAACSWRQATQLADGASGAATPLLNQGMGSGSQRFGVVSGDYVRELFLKKSSAAAWASTVPPENSRETLFLTPPEQLSPAAIAAPPIKTEG